RSRASACSHWACRRIGTGGSLRRPGLSAPARREAGLRGPPYGRHTLRRTQTMRFAILGSGAVGGYYGARLARAGHDVTFIARGAHLAAIRSRGLEIRSPMTGDFIVHARAEEDTSQVGPVDV